MRTPSPLTTDMHQQLEAKLVRSYGYYKALHITAIVQVTPAGSDGPDSPSNWTVTFECVNEAGRAQIRLTYFTVDLQGKMEDRSSIIIGYRQGVDQ